VFVVASAREGFDPAAVLLEFEGLRRDTPPRRETGKDAAAGARFGTSVSSGSGWWSDSGGLGATLRAQDSVTKADTLVHGRSRERSHWDGMENPHPTLNQSFNTGAIGYSNQELFSQRGAGLVGEASTGEVSHCLNAGGMGRQDYETETLIAHTLKGEGFDASEDGTGRGTPLVPVAYRTMGHDGSHANGGGQMAVAVPLQEVGKRTGVSTDDPRAGIGIGQDGDPMFTLQAGAQHGVAHAVAFHPSQDPISSTDGSTHALGCGSKGGQASIAVAVSLRGRDGGGTAELGGDIQNALRASQGGGDKPHVLAAVGVGADCYNGDLTGDVAMTLKAAGGEGNPSINLPSLVTNMAVRRLTPTECERLQGFPDGYTNIPWRGKPEAPDGPRYKALGNSMAVPVMRWIGRRIAEALK
jgi:DNA (cytosine-5)-methyltransferase 1